ncbi:type II secretion system F family protein [Kineosporia sp. A_224]|uniref:type II secretion system F family protein n=1 Tax=Kineosporia sp. A_224 TaxID=1962180 RepID=UPI000B4C0A3F|nr:type II secretion system F family protein [Kineosporia sp. A_224]
MLSANLLLAIGLLLVFLALTCTFTWVALRMVGPSGVERSLAAIGQVAAPRDLRAQQLQRPFSERVVDPLLTSFVQVGHRFTPDDRVLRIRRRLDLAGNPVGWDADRILGLKALGGLVGAVLGLFGALVLGGGPLWLLVATVVVGLLGWAVPSLWLYQTAHDRSERLRRDLPDAMDLLTISVEAGMAFDAAVAQVARKTAGPVAQEFTRMLQEMQIGTGRMQALRALADRSDVPELQSFVGAMVQADAFGIPVASVLRVQSKETRTKRSQRAEEAAQRVPIKILLPLIFCILPCLFIIILGPAVITILQNLKGL